VLRFVDHSRVVTFPGRAPQPRTLVTIVRYPLARERFPLIVFGHGFAVTPKIYSQLLQAWARAGYVVAAPLFPLGNANAPGGPDESDIVNQPRDMSFVLTQLLLADAATTSPLHGLIDPARIAVAGQSDGAMTAFATAYEKPWRDDRVRAAVILSGAELGRHVPIDPTPVPLLAVQGTADHVNEPKYSLALFHAVARPKFLLLLQHAGHLAPYTTPGARLATVERVSVAFLQRYLGNGSLSEIEEAAARLPTASLTSAP
jgi:dienelactone hydrolase